MANEKRKPDRVTGGVVIVGFVVLTASAGLGYGPAAAGIAFGAALLVLGLGVALKSGPAA